MNVIFLTPVTEERAMPLPSAHLNLTDAFLSTFLRARENLEFARTNRGLTLYVG